MPGWLKRKGRGDTSLGMTLLELVIAIAVLAIGTIAVMRAVDQSRLGIGGDGQRLMAQIAAQNRAEELRLLGSRASALPDEVEIGGQRLRLMVETEATAGGLLKATVRARSEAGPGALVITYVSAMGAER